MKVFYDKAVQKVPVKAWVDHVPLEDEAKKQLENLSTMPFMFRHVAAMPDCHWGMGATVGSVIATKNAIIPAAVGVDIGCGMMAVKTSLKASDLPENLAPLRSEIERLIPHGRTNNGGSGDRGAWHNVSNLLQKQWQDNFDLRYKEICEKHPGAKAYNTINHLGTLGGGNHFIEVCIDLEQNVWIMLHSGSRGLGNKIGQYFIEKAKEDMKRWFIHLPDEDLAYIPQGSPLFDDYIKAVELAQEFALMNRANMMEAAILAMKTKVPKPFIIQDHAINCHHNYIAQEHHFGSNIFVTRKGAVRARTTDLGIIPGSMGARSFIVKGRGNEESFCSCSHGAGRVMSRNQAKKEISLSQHIADTAGVECRKDADVIDESPRAYKNIVDVMKSQEDLVEIVAELKQVLCVKG